MDTPTKFILIHFGDTARPLVTGYIRLLVRFPGAYNG
jgi:hypothetical protein